MRKRVFRLSIAPAVPIVLVWLLVSTRAAGQGGAPAREGGRPQTVAGCPGASQQFYPCAKAKSQAFNPPRMPDGKPDMRGAWNNPTTTGSQNIENYPGDGFLGPAKTLIVVGALNGLILPISLGVIARLIRTLNDSLGQTSIVVSHDVEECFAIVDYVYFMADGRIVAEGTPEAMRDSKEAFVSQFVHGETDGPIPFHYPASPYEKDLEAIGG